MHSRTVILHILTAMLLLYGFLLGLSGIDLNGGGIYWLVLTAGCPFLFGVQLTLIIKGE